MTLFFVSRSVSGTRMPYVADSVEDNAFCSFQSSGGAMSVQTELQPPPARDGAMRFFFTSGVDGPGAFMRLGVSEASPFDPTGLRAALESGAQALVLFRRAETHVVAAMEHGSNPIDALSDWTVEIRRLFFIQRRHRRRILLAEDSLLQTEGDKLRPLMERLGLAGPLPAASAPPASPDPLHLALALQLVSATPEALLLRDELEASSLPNAPLALSPQQITLAMEQMKALVSERETALGQVAVSRKALQEERDLLNAHILELQQESEARSALAARLETRLAQMEEQHRISVDHARKATQREEALSAQVAALEAERDKIFASHSWTITEPLRALNNMLGGIAGKSK